VGTEELIVQTIVQNDALASNNKELFKSVNCDIGLTAPIIINGCVVSISCTDIGTVETLEAVKDILLSAYRTKIARV